MTTSSRASWTNRFETDVANQVIEYLSKKGYSRTEAMLRMESAATGADGRPLYQKSNDQGVEKYFKAFGQWESTPRLFLSDGLQT